MKPSTVWIAIVLLVIGVCGILDAAGMVSSGETIGQWWPLAVVGWAVAEMIGARRATFGGAVVVAIGLALLAGTQEWGGDALIWSALAIFIGLAVLVDASRQTSRSARGDERGSGPSTSWWDACWAACWPAWANDGTRTSSNDKSGRAS